MEPQALLLDDNEKQPRRRALLPWWIKVFVWIFMVIGAIAIPAFLISAIVGLDFNVALYGLETNQPMSVLGFGLTFLFFLKGCVSYGLWWEKDWAPSLAILDAAIGIVICVSIMLLVPLVSEGNNVSFSFKLELILLLPYIYKIIKIRDAWERAENAG